MPRRFVLVLLLLGLALTVAAQSINKPQAQLFDDFKVTTQADLITHTTRLRSRLQKKDWKGVSVFHFVNSKQKQAYNVRTTLIDNLYKDCNDCFGFDPLITFFDIDDSNAESIQFWIIPPNA